MIQTSIVFFVLAIVAYVFGAYGIAGVTLEIGKTLLWIFIILSAISFIYSLFSDRKLKH